MTFFFVVVVLLLHNAVLFVLKYTVTVVFGAI